MGKEKRRTVFPGGMFGCDHPHDAAAAFRGEVLLLDHLVWAVTEAVARRGEDWADEIELTTARPHEFLLELAQAYYRAGHTLADMCTEYYRQAAERGRPGGES